MPKKPNAVKASAESYAKRVVTSTSKQKKIAKDTSMLPMERQMQIDQVHRDATVLGPKSVKSAIQFAVASGVSKPKIVGSYYAGAIKGAVKGVAQNIRNR